MHFKRLHTNKPVLLLIFNTCFNLYLKFDVFTPLGSQRHSLGKHGVASEKCLRSLALKDIKYYKNIIEARM